MFGLLASLVFAWFEPQFADILHPAGEPVVTIPKDDIDVTEQEDTEEPTEAVKPEEPPAETEEQEDTKEPPAVVEPREFTIADFQKLQNELYAVGREANKFVVISDVQEVYVTFINEVSVAAAMKKYDGNTGIAILSVPRESVDEETMKAIAVATLGNSLLTTQGMIAIAVGSPLGTNYSILTGNITSTNNSISTVDNNYTVFTTDIVGSEGGSGAIINVEGEVIGLVMQDYSSAGDESTLTALSISELKRMIEMLSNNQDIPYIGLELITVTNDIANEYDIPKGAYIREVRMDSPAMAAGLQSGDVITSVDGEIIYNVDSFENKLLTLTPGETVSIVVERQSADGYKEITCTAEIRVLQ